MTKSELVKQISYSTGIDYATALTVVEAFMSEVKSSLANQEPVFLRGFGSFILKHLQDDYREGEQLLYHLLYILLHLPL